MKVNIVIDSRLFKRPLCVEIDWNFPHLPRIGEQISPLIIMLSPKLTYENLIEFLTDEAINDFCKDLTCNEEVEEYFRDWIYDVICEANIIESIHYISDKEDYTKIIPEIYLSDLRN